MSAFSNSGLTLFSNGLLGFATDRWFCLPLMAAVVLGGIGFPVLFGIGRRLRPALLIAATLPSVRT